ncbi:hypothetical protein BGW42_008189 [Actinomortierella wolfii]|nr:hypothetical protein BGW42_008189 [Actinomortierella wolfii]
MEALLQEAQTKVVPFLSSIVGNETIVTLMTAYHLAVSTLLDASNSGSASFSFESSTFPGQDTFSNYEYRHHQYDEYDYQNQGDGYGFQQQGAPKRRPMTAWQMVSMGTYYILSFIHSMVWQIMHAQLGPSFSPAAKSLISFVFTCLIALLLFRIAISIITSIFRSVLWLLQTAVVMSLVGVAIWVVYSLTSGGDSSSTSKNQDSSFQAWNKEYERQQREYQKMFKNR